MKKLHLLPPLILFAIVLGVGVCLFQKFFLSGRLPDGERLGVTFSPIYARELGLNPEETLKAIVDDLKVTHFRIPLYWSLTESSQGTFDFSETDALVDIVAKAKGTVILAIGERLPRYPECHFPEWAKRIGESERKVALLNYLRKAVMHYDNHPEIVMWQVENEPLFTFFGDCPKPDIDLLGEEVTAVRLLSKKPILITSSGEFGSWIREAQEGDVLGISLYRGAQFENLGYVPYPTKPWFYRVKYWSSEPYVKKILISELQIEPWAMHPLVDIPVESQLAGMNADVAQASLQFARDTGIRETYLWGAEWWYWLKTKKAHPELWEWARGKFVTQQSLSR